MREISVVTSSLSVSDNVWSELCIQYVEITTLISLITHPGMNPKAQAVYSVPSKVPEGLLNRLERGL